MREDSRMVEMEDNMRYTSEILVWQHCILSMGLRYRVRYKDSGGRKLNQEIVINYSWKNTILTWCIDKVL